MWEALPKFVVSTVFTCMRAASLISMVVLPRAAQQTHQLQCFLIPFVTTDLFSFFGSVPIGKIFSQKASARKS